MEDEYENEPLLIEHYAPQLLEMVARVSDASATLLSAK